jgi:hypothetical protein
VLDTGERSLERGKGVAVDSPKLADGNEANETFQRRRLTEEVTRRFWQPLESEVGGLGAIYLLFFFDDSHTAMFCLYCFFPNNSVLPQ